MLLFSVLVAAESAAGGVLALVGGVVEFPADPALNDRWAVLERTDRAVASKCSEEFLVEDLACCGFISKCEYKGGLRGVEEFFISAKPARIRDHVF